MKKFIILILSTVLITSCSAKTINADINQEGAIETSSVDSKYNEVVTEAAGTPVVVGSAATPDGAHGGSGICTIHTGSYHGVPGEFIDYIGTEAFNGWTKTLIKETDYNDGICTSTGTFLNFLSYFNITKEEFCKIYYNTNSYYTSIHDADIIYSGDAKKIEAYYRDIDYEAKEIKWRNIELIYKMQLCNLFVKEVNSKVNSDLLNARRTSIKYLIGKSGVAKEEAKKMLADLNERNLSNLNYDFDTIYNNQATLATSETLPSVEEAIAADDSIRILK